MLLGGQDIKALALQQAAGYVVYGCRSQLARARAKASVRGGARLAGLQRRSSAPLVLRRAPGTDLTGMGREAPPRLTLPALRPTLRVAPLLPRAIRPMSESRPCASCQSCGSSRPLISGPSKPLVSDPSQRRGDGRTVWALAPLLVTAAVLYYGGHLMLMGEVSSPPPRALAKC